MMFACVHTCICVCTHVCMYAWIRECMYACILVCLHKVELDLHQVTDEHLQL